MKRDTLSKLTHLALVPFILALLIARTAALAGTPTASPEAKVRRLVFVSAGFTEGNRFWTISRPFHLQFDPFLETLLDVDP